MVERLKHGFLLVLTQPAASLEEEFNAWYDTEHRPERMTVPGFLTGLRFVAVDGGHPKYLAYYDMVRPETLESDEYKAISGANFSPWTKRVTSRVIVDRRAGRQIWPGDAKLSRAPRLRLLRFEGDRSEGATLVEGLRDATEASPGALTLLVAQADAPTCFYAFIRMAYTEPESSFFPRLGALQERIAQNVVYTPYDSRPWAD